MTITNKYGLPQALVRALQSDYYYRDKRYSVTTLLSPVRETILKRRHHKEIVTDAADMIWALWGSGIHKILENKSGPNELSEQQMEYKFGNGYTLSGYSDLVDLNNQEIVDYKTTSVWQYNNQTSKNDWQKQLQMYAYLFYKMRGIWLSKGKIWLFMRDWSKNQARQNKNYPDKPIAPVEFDLGTPEEIEQWILANLDKLIQAEKLADNDLPLCTPEERWNDGNRFAIIKKGAKRAVKLHDNLDDAKDHLANLDELEGAGKYVIENRYGVDKKCLDYCSVNTFCEYYKETYSEDN